MKNRQQLDDVSVQMSRTNSTDGRPFRLRVTDQASGVLIADVRLDELAFADLMSTATAYGTAEAATVEQYSRVGLQRTVQSEKVPGGVYGSKYARDEALALIEPWAEKRRVEMGADTVRIDSTRDGYSAVFSTYA